MQLSELRVELRRHRSPRHAFRSPPQASRREAAFTILEILAACFIVAILSALLVVVANQNMNRFEYPACANNLKNLHVALSEYTQDNGHWPQVPPEILTGSYAEHDWWAATLKDYGMTGKSWKCPTITRLTRTKVLSESNVPKIHYLPSLFDDSQFTPYRWKEMPWAMEAGDMHGSGNLMLFGDGSIRSYRDVYESVLKSGSYIRK